MKNRQNRIPKANNTLQSKVMFMAAVGCPCYEPHCKQYFDGKFGIWPSSEMVATKCSSKNRSRGIMETKPTPRRLSKTLIFVKCILQFTKICQLITKITNLCTAG